jgi:hypothetical protein
MVHRGRKSTSGEISLHDLNRITSNDHVRGAQVASEAFRQAGVRHVLVGGLAVGLGGYPRYTRDVDFLVGDEAFVFHGPLVTPRPGLPLRYGQIAIDWVSLEPGERSAFEPYLQEAIYGEVPVMPIVPLVAMKLIAGRQKDHADVVELIKAGADLEEIRSFVAEHFRERLNKLDKLASLALAESR